MWRSSSDNIKRSYAYQYDALNRLLEGYYQKTGADNFMNERLRYDINGNITTLKRWGVYENQPTTYSALTPNYDDLAYTYDTGNKLLKVTDATNSSNGFNNGTSGTNTDYTYDTNGNMTTDLNKAIASITYNHLNLPVIITFSGVTTKKIEYLYSANGSKVNKKVTNGTTIAETDYLTGFQTERARFANTITAQRSEAEQISNSAQYVKPNATVWDLQFFPTAETEFTRFANTINVQRSGTNKKRNSEQCYVDAVRVGTNTVFTYVYNYTDHLGNVRLSYAYDINNATIKIMEENNYYPFGLKMRGFNFSKTNINPPVQCPTCPPVFVLSQDTNYKYKYNGKEFQDELNLNLYDYGARNYDASIGRWMNVDPLAETSRRFNPYTYCLNNPVFFIDPDGMISQSFIDEIWNKSDSNTIWTNNNGTLLGDNGEVINNKEEHNSNGENTNSFEDRMNEKENDKSNNIASNQNDNTSDNSKDCPTCPKPKKEKFKATKSIAAIALVISQADSPVPGPGDLIAGGLLLGAVIIDLGTIIYDEMSQGKGERGRTAKPSGTDNPFKHLKPDPNKPGNVLQKDPHTGKTVSKPAPPGYNP